MSDPQYVVNRFDAARAEIDQAEADAKAAMRRDLDQEIARRRDPLESHTAAEIAWCGWDDPRS